MGDVNVKYYKMVCIHDHPHADANGIIAEHIVMAEKKLGRYLREGETVHHIDGNKKNNSPDNLMVFATRADHTLYHHGGVAYEKGDVWICKRINVKAVCEFCGRVFILPKGRKIREHIYCSMECAYAARGKINSEIDDVIDELHRCNGNFTKASVKFGVSSNALVKMLKVNGLKYHSSDYKTKQVSRKRKNSSQGRKGL